MLARWATNLQVAILNGGWTDAEEHRVPSRVLQFLPVFPLHELALLCVLCGLLLNSGSNFLLPLGTLQIRSFLALKSPLKNYKAVVNNKLSPPKWLPIAICFGLILTTAILYWPVRNHEFIALDDPDYVTSNPHARAGLTAANIKWAFTKSHSSNWHPLTWISHMVDCQFFGMDAGKHHLVNVGFHAANSALLFLLLYYMTGAIWRSGFVAALFAFHPLHIESVAWVAERKDMLSTFFFMLTLLAYARYVRGAAIPAGSAAVLGGSTPPNSSPLGTPLHTRHTAFFYILTLVLFALGLMSKAMLVTLPCVLLLMDFWPLGRFSLASFKDQKPVLIRLVVEKIPFFALSLGSCLMTIWAQGTGHSIATIDQVPFGYRVLNSLISYPKYIGKMLKPTNLAILYPLGSQINFWFAVIAAVLLIGCTLIALWMAKKYPYAIVGWLWFLGTLVPVIGIMQVGSQAMADRYTYIPLIGLFFALAWVATDFVRSLQWGKVVVAVAGIAILGAAYADTTKQVPYWKSSRTLFEHVVQVNPQNFLALIALGNMASKEHDYQKGYEYLSSAVKAAPQCAAVYMGLAIAQDGLDQREAAEANYQIALQLEPYNPEIRYSYGGYLIQKGEPEKAEIELRKVLAQKPDMIETWINLIIALRNQGKVQEAAQECKALLKLDPTCDLAQLNLGDIMMQSGKMDEAIVHYREALRLNPKSQDAAAGLGLALVEKRDFPGATQQFESILKTEPKNAKAVDGLGYVLAMQGKCEEARPKFREALKLEPKYPYAHFHLALCLTGQGGIKEAIDEYRKALSLDGKLPLALNNLAWVLAASPDPALRNGAEAVEMAERACKLTNNEQPFYLGTLAAAYAEAGRFSDAIQKAEMARDLAQKGGLALVAQRNEELLAYYRAGKAFHEPGQSPTNQ